MRARELDAAPFQLRAQADRQHCAHRLDGGPRDRQPCGNVATHEIDGRYYCQRHAASVALELLCLAPIQQRVEASEAAELWFDLVKIGGETRIRKWDVRPFPTGIRYERRP